MPEGRGILAEIGDEEYFCNIRQRNKVILYFSSGLCDIDSVQPAYRIFLCRIFQLGDTLWW